MKLRLLLILFSMSALLVATHPAIAQQKGRDNFGKEFWVAYGPNLGGSDEQNSMALYLTSHVPARGSVEVPALGFYQTFTTQPGKITTIDLPDGNGGSPTVELTDDLDERVIKGMAVHITSDSDVAVFGLNHKLYSSDAFMGLPNQVLGTEYRTINYVASDAEPPRGEFSPSEFWMVAIADSTNVKITLKMNSFSHSANNPFNVRLNKGDAYLVEGMPELGNDLTGSLIESDQPIAVFSGHRRTAIPEGFLGGDGTPSRDHLVEELPPVSAWGDSALVVPFATAQAADLVRIVCAEDQTEISVNGASVGANFKAGDFYEITSLKAVTSIQASKPILTGQYMHTAVGGLRNTHPAAYGDPALALVYPVEQFDTEYTIVSIVDPSSYSGNFVNIVAPSVAISTMRIDNVPVPPSEFIPIAGSQYSYAQHRLVQGTHSIRGGAPFGVTIYGLGQVDSYAYTGGTQLKTITPLETVGLVIDFGDRVLTAPLTPTNSSNIFDTIVTLRNISEDTVKIYDFPRRIQDTDRFFVTSPLASTVAPHIIPPGASDQMTIEFNPHEVNRRMHTQITAKTDHLRAYVVDVYGRGVQDVMGVFSDAEKSVKIDTLDFGVFQNSDLPADSEFYAGNAGLANLVVGGIAIGGPNAAEFTNTSSTYNGVVVTPPFGIPEAPSAAARINVRFTPDLGLANGVYLAYDTVRTASGNSTHIVVLRAHIETIFPLSKPDSSHLFGTTRVCTDSAFDVQFTNTNDVPVTITDANILGVNAGDFALTTRVPLTVSPHQSASVSVHFLPSARGMRQAQLVLAFNLPKNTPNDTVQLAGTGDKLSLEFAGSQAVSGYAITPFIVPIYAKQDLTPFGATSYSMHVSYDSVYLQLVNALPAGTLTPSGYVTISGYSPGRDTIYFTQGGEGQNSTVISGGGTGAPPLLNLEFKAQLQGEDPQTFTRQFAIDFDVNLLDSKIPSPCTDQIFDAGQAEVVSVCSTPDHLIEPNGGQPLMTMLEPVTPNPFSVATTMSYDVSQEGRVTIDVCNAAGVPVRTLVDGVLQPGYYTVTLEGQGLSSGAYLVSMKAGTYHGSRTVLLTK